MSDGRTPRPIDGREDSCDLLLAHEHTAPGEEVKELPTAKKVAPVVTLDAPGFDDDLVGRVHREKFIS